MATKYGYLNEDTFENIALAIREKNGSSTTYKPSEMPDAIKAIDTKPAASTPVTETIAPGETATVPAGYYEGASTISANLATTADQIDAAVKAPGVAKILSPGESYHMDGGYYRTSDTEIQASLANEASEIEDSIKLGAVTYQPSINTQTITAGKYLSGDQTIAAITTDNLPSDLQETRVTTASLTNNVTVNASTGKVMTSVTVNAPDMSAADVNAADIVIGKKAYGADGTLITGTHEEAGGVDTSDATATTADIISGQTAYTAAGKVTGTLEVLNYYSSASIPDASLGQTGDLYFKLES